MRFLTTAIPDVFVIEPQVFGDARGFFMETYHRARFSAAGIDADFVQDNHSRSVKGTLRGLHYQIQQAQGKLVRVVQGAVFDVAVDMRRSSPTFGQWVGEILSAENKRQMWVPPGFAHGFYVLSDSADFVYKCTALYAPEHERCVRWDDATLAIAWPLVDGAAPLVSTKDAAGVSFREAECYP
ncbi:dTDP-4-dehydrorhamnose 3,5-epimerase [Sulfurivermis fontis]|jgi:dTDP-4-dehydrorhamnose 3,5-epimerase|uniref:dTDP-4-dehydrorhamnose 3,5-epimerase n=1 Tax=Sulfurivermis fontis TaxID=1972068 RepID=UPI000FDA2FD1|nr:dTDP-4-dehydrorhamnose 3,5-epimerase [Sulfurivermis fontis]